MDLREFNLSDLPIGEKLMPPTKKQPLLCYWNRSLKSR